MAGQKKSTKKFEKKHLKDILERRKEHAKVKQRHQLKDKRKAENAKSRADREEAAQESPEQAQKDNAFAEMNVDDFFAGGFDIADSAADLSKKSRKKDVTPKIGKRKRSEEQKEDEEASAASGSEEDVASDDDAASEASGPDAFEEHKDQLEALKERDPEFYKYLKENDSELLDFGDLAEVDELSESEEEEGPAKKKKKKAAKEEEEEEKTDNTLDIATVKKWQKLMEEQHSIRAMRQAVLAFRAAANINEASSQEQKYTISDSDVYHQVLVTALSTVPRVLAHHLPVKESASGKIKVSLDSKKFKTLTPLIKSHTSSVHLMLTNLSDEQTLKLTLSSIEPMLPYLLQFRKLLKVVIKTVVGIWADVATTEATRITGFLLLRRLMIIGDAGLKETVLKASYEGVVKGSRNTTVHTLPGVNLMKNSAAELWGIDQNVSYTTGFNFIRQLAMHLRKSITTTSKESYKTVYNWQYVHSLDFWSRVLSQHCDGLAEAKAGKQSPLRPLLYPVVQITIGAMRLIPTAQYLPLRFQLTRTLLRLSRATGTYIPLASALLEVLNLAEMRKPPKSSTLRQLDFNTAIRAPKSYLRTRVYQDGVGEQVAELLSEFFVLWTKHIAFPELSVPIVVSLKRWLKTASSRSTGNKNAKINQMILLLVQKVEANARWIEERRLGVSYTPRNRAEVDTFLKDVDWEATPLGAFVKSQRKLREEKAALLEQSRLEEEKRRAEEKEEEKRDTVMDGVISENDDSDDDEEEGESEEEVGSSDGDEDEEEEEEEEEEEDEDEDELEFEDEEE
ncbi:Noc2-domain-containing protein [Aspergillus heteromorphus CBS 117.55]|uniref:Noc2-domain-containing protein n=1 Tax=Aspergillus heteromorphus CBS 117.55 TaxID=1448321 RepID=A0A317WU91_9EURO|nr:Noc2-domain-containing protein [Aspergillus heteromorphus CBS 117.55]PWY89993.1 Noc2-domain-containing protein [Aspergillus heteromorphus CBS 117.55]